MKRFLIALLLIPTVQIYAPTPKPLHLEAKSIHGFPISYTQPQFPDYSHNASTNSAANDAVVAAEAAQAAQQAADALAAQQAAQAQQQAAAAQQAAYEAQQQALYAAQQARNNVGSCWDWLAEAGVTDPQDAHTLIMRESGCRVDAYNPSGAFGIPQSLPGDKMASAGADWQTNPITQLRWMQSYVFSTYGSWANALNHSYQYNWY